MFRFGSITFFAYCEWFWGFADTSMVIRAVSHIFARFHLIGFGEHYVLLWNRHLIMARRCELQNISYDHQQSLNHTLEFLGCSVDDPAGSFVQLTRGGYWRVTIVCWFNHSTECIKFIIIGETLSASKFDSERPLRMPGENHHRRVIKIVERVLRKLRHFYSYCDRMIVKLFNFSVINQLFNWILKQKIWIHIFQLNVSGSEETSDRTYCVPGNLNILPVNVLGQEMGKSG